MAATFGPPRAARACASSPTSPTSQVFVDGEDKGKAPVTMNDHQAGRAHRRGAQDQVQARRADGSRGRRARTPSCSLRMETAPPDRPHGILKVQSTVPNAEVFLDGSSLGRAPVDRNDLDPGKHYIVVHKDGYADFKREVVLVENQPVALVADLSATGAVRVLSTPEGADVRIDGELIGKTPVAARRRRRRRPRHRAPRSRATSTTRRPSRSRAAGRSCSRSTSSCSRPAPRRSRSQKRKQGDVVLRRQGQPGGRRHRRLRPRLPLLLHRAAHGRAPSTSSRSGSTWASSSRPSSRSTTWRCTAACSWSRPGRWRWRSAATSAAAPAPTAATRYFIDLLGASRRWPSRRGDLLG